MSKPEIRCWRDSKGRRIVHDFLMEIAQSDPSGFKRLDGLFRLLRELGRYLKMPQVKYLGDDLYELRDHHARGPGYRIYYAWIDDSLVLLLVGGTKKTQQQDIQLAFKRLKELYK